MAKRTRQPQYLTVILIIIGILIYTYYKNTHQATQEVEPLDTSSIQSELNPVKVEEVTDTEIESFFSTATDKKLEMPAKLKTRSEKIMNRRNYTVSYNANWNMPNWVAWDITREEVSSRYDRKDEFTPDPDLSETRAVTTRDYVGSGYDRGHMCPAGDNRFDSKAMDECFYMTNICPQNHNLNQGTWNDLEISCRQWAKRYGRVYVVCGPIVNKNNDKTIGRDHKVTVPNAFFKVILVSGNKNPRAIGYIFQNNGGKNNYKTYSIDEVERITGIDFFPTLPDNIENWVEANYNESLWKWNNN